MLTADKNLHKATVFFFFPLTVSLSFSLFLYLSLSLQFQLQLGLSTYGPHRYTILYIILQRCQTRPLLIECPRGCTHCPRITIFAL